MPKAPDFGYFGDVFASAIVVSIVSYMGSIALAKGFEQKTKETYKQQLSIYTQWCRDNVVTMDNNDPEEFQNGCNDPNGHNGQAGGHEKLPETQGSTSKEKAIISTPERISPDQQDTEVKLKEEGVRESQDTVTSVANASFSPTLSEKGKAGSTAIPLMNIDKYSCNVKQNFMFIIFYSSFFFVNVLLQQLMRKKMKFKH